jgi:hypothetical protein
MKLDKNTLTKTMAFLLSIPPETNLAKLLKLCLISQYNSEKLGKNTLEKTQELIQNTSSLPYWIQEIIQSNDKITKEEWEAFGELNLKDTQKFMDTLFEELDNIKFD